MNDWLDKQHEQHTKAVSDMKPKAGMWAQMTSEYGDVWHEIESVYLVNPKDKFLRHSHSSMYLYCHRKNQNPVETCYFYKIRKVVSRLPENARVIVCKEGYFSPRSENMDKLPERVRKQWD